VRAIDQAASKGVIKKGTASRSVSRLTVAVAGLKS
jgi:ribosomal protein S20